MNSLLVFVFSLYAALAFCPPGFDLVKDGQCRGFYTTVTVPDDVAENIASNKCSEIKGLPIIIHDDEEQAYWKSRATGAYELVLGLVCNSSRLWMWADGSPVDYHPPSYLPTLDEECGSGCVWMQGKDGMWREFPAADGCDGFEDDAEDGVCYQVGDTAESFNDAQLICRKLGSNLASIHNDQENAFIRRLAVSKGEIHGLFIGATSGGTGEKAEDFLWVDGSAWDFSNFYNGFPKDDFGDCLSMDTSTTTGQWVNIDCATKLPAACVRGHRTAPVCSSETWKEHTLITSPGFPYSSSTPCEFFFKVDAGKKVQVEILLLEANSCCDSVTIYDGYLGGDVLVSLTGEVYNVNYTTTTSNIMKVAWQPNGGVNVLGLAMVFRAV